MLPENVVLYLPFQEVETKCLEELNMMKLSQEIRSKPNWNEKIFKPEIVAKWKKEAQGLSLEAIEYVIDEVKYLATLKGSKIEAGPVQGTWVASDLIDETTLSRLKQLVEPLDKAPEKDFHPGSDELVVDLVHPSLYCYVEDKSILINAHTIGKQFMPSGKTPGEYRWLPSEVSCDESGTISIDSYINNLHPIQHKNLYLVLGEILQKFIPMFNRSLTDIANWKSSAVIDLSAFNWYGGEEFIFEEGSESEGEAYREWQRNRHFLPVPVPKFEPPEAPKNVVDLKEEKLQVIFKLANIELTPEKSKYRGGTWHVEGIEEERIVATGIYYYEVENVTESKLHFRQSITDPNYEQDDRRGVYEIYGLENEAPMNQKIGYFKAEQGKCIVFPNAYQHRVAPFELLDKTKPGFRKILVFFLVDPTVKVISTHNVLPQQQEWKDVEPHQPADKRYVMTREEAESMREKLMFERKYYRDEVEKEVYEREFSLCEH